jgi:small subunit ribosomal protein S25e
MGGTKKKTMAAQEKSQDSQTTPSDDGTKPKKGEKSKSAPQQQKRLSFLPPKMSEEEMLKALTPLKAITVYGASRALGVNSSIASGILRTLEGKKMLSRAGGFSGHYVWTSAA